MTICAPSHTPLTHLSHTSHTPLTHPRTPPHTPAHNHTQSHPPAHLRQSSPPLSPNPAGEIKQEEFAATGIDGELFADIDKALDERTIGHNPERLSLLKGGIVYSNAVTTVSPTYAKEVLSGGASGWLRETMAKPHITAKVGLMGGSTVLLRQGRGPCPG
jgi:hypothetical protein